MKLPIVSLAILGGQAFMASTATGGLLEKVSEFGSYYTGIRLVPGGAQFFPQNLLVGYGPWLAKRFIMPVVHPRIPPSLHLPISLS